MVISICVGSSCHLKGSYEVVNKFQELIISHKLENIVELKASFCLGKCANNSVSITIDNEFVEGCRPETVEDIFIEKVLKKLGD